MNSSGKQAAFPTTGGKQTLFYRHDIETAWKLYNPSSSDLQTISWPLVFGHDGNYPKPSKSCP